MKSEKSKTTRKLEAHKSLKLEIDRLKKMRGKKAKKMINLYRGVFNV